MEPFTAAFLLISTLIGVTSSIATAQAQKSMNDKNIEFQKEANQQQMAFNSAEAEKQRAWETEMSNTQVQRSMADYQAAGLNPLLAVPGGAGVSSGASAQSNITAPRQQFATSTLSSLLSGMTNTMQSMTNFYLTKKLIDSKSSMMDARTDTLANQLGVQNKLKQKLGTSSSLDEAKIQSILSSISRSSSSASKLKKNGFDPL